MPVQVEATHRGASRSLTARMSPAPPSLIRHSPSRTRPAPYAESTWSAPPTTIAVPAARPVAAAALRLTSPTTVAGAHTSSKAGQRTLVASWTAAIAAESKSYRPLSIAQFSSTWSRAPRACGEPVVRATDRGHLLPDLGLVKIEPARRGCHRLLREDRPGESQEVEVAEGRANVVDLTRRARVVLQNRSAQRPILLIEEHHRGHHARYRQGCDVGARRAHVAQQQRYERGDTATTIPLSRLPTTRGDHCKERRRRSGSPRCRDPGPTRWPSPPTIRGRYREEVIRTS